MSHSIGHMRVVVVLCIAGVLFSAAGAAGAPADATARRQREAELIQTLEGNASRAEKDKACRELQVIGTPACIPALAAMLADKDLSHMARYALEPMAYPQAAKALRDALDKARGPVKVGVITSLGFKGDAEAAGQLIALLGGLDVEVAGAAAAALGRIGTPEAARALDKLRARARGRLRDVGAEASLTAAERLVRRGLQVEAVRIYEDLQGAAWPAHVRLGAFVGLLAAGGDQAVARATAAIAGGDAAIRAVAIANIATLEGPAVGRRLAAELPKLPPEAQILLIGALTARGDATVRPAIVTAAGSASGEVRVAALTALGKIGDADCVEVLCKAAAEGKSEAERQAAIDSLWIVPGEGTNAAILKQMAAAPPGARAKLIGALVARKATGAVAGLLREAASADARVVAAAFKALGQLAEPKDLPGMVRLLVGLRGDEARPEAERAVAHVARKIADEAAGAETVLAALKSAKAAPAKASLLRALGHIANAGALAAVRAALDEGDPTVRDAALRTLADWPDVRALDALRGVFRTTDNRIHRILALRGCVRVLGLGGLGPERTLETYRELMKAATRTDDRKLVLAGLATVADPAAVAAVEPYLADPQVGAEAELAMLAIARGMMGSAGKEAKLTAERLLARSKNEAIRRQAKEIIVMAERFGDFIVGWQVSGPYTGGNLFDSVFPPEKGNKGVAWRRLPITSRTQDPWMLDLQGTVGGEGCVAYVRTWIHSDAAGPARLEMGSDDGIKVWLNGKVVHANDTPGAAIAGEEKAKVSLAQGWNTLMLKIVQDTGPWEFCARFRSPDGGPMTGLRVDAAREAPTPKAAPAPPKAPQVFTEAGPWAPLFNGKDLAGWRKTGTAVFTVEDGCLVGTQTDGKGGDLWTTADFDNFELQVTYRVVWPANTGFWFRHDGKRGYQYDVLKYKNPVAFSGTLYCPGKMFITKNLKESLENRDGWNEARLCAAGEELTLWLNGTQTGTVRDSTLSKGKIGIQVHPGNGFKGMKIIIRKMDVRPLKARGGGS